jgi:hypothetical protein
MSIPATGPQVLDFFGTPLIIEPLPGQLSSDAGLLMRAYLLCGWLGGFRLREAFLLEWEENDALTSGSFALPVAIIGAPAPPKRCAGVRA